MGLLGELMVWTLGMQMFGYGEAHRLEAYALNGYHIQDAITTLSPTADSLTAGIHEKEASALGERIPRSSLP